jgi:hypothetical protein
MDKGMKNGIVVAVWRISVVVALIVAAVFQRRLLEAVSTRVEASRRLTVDQFGKPMMDLFIRARHHTHTRRMVLQCVPGIPPLSV